ncbi:SGNH/GDSL hydrolase family protein [Gryllotalpicola reticulitermitis]|uniref:SGNH/GDSL hydrolase family protein n=1 Tax=Gryllotalpicola reticulitermitis TaxID=1184153 RepID=A0ABV8Q3K8_9MICO
MRTKAYLRARRRREAATAGHVVVCLGDSLTDGVMSAPYVPYLEREFGPDGYAFVNAGISGDLAYNVLQRLDDVIACRPDVVVIACGANDAAAHISEEWTQWYLKAKHAPQRPTIEWYEATLTEIVKRLRAETSARLALLELPPFTEELDGVVNERVRRYNDIVRTVGDATGTPVIPLYDAMAAQIPADFAPPVFDGSRRHMGRALRDHYLFRRSWDTISRRNGFVLHTDFAHMNTRGARIIAAQIGAFLHSNAAASTAQPRNGRER